MAQLENKKQAETAKLYISPTIVRMGGVRELTAGNPDEILSDGRMKPNGYKDVEINPIIHPAIKSDDNLDA